MNIPFAPTRPINMFSPVKLNLLCLPHTPLPPYTLIEPFLVALLGKNLPESA